MKILLFFIFTLVLNASAINGYSQKKALQLKLKQVSLEDAIYQVEESAGYKFYYNSSVVDVNQLVSVEYTGMAIEELLDQVFKNSGIKYSIIEDKVILSRILDDNELQQVQEIKIIGKVIDANGDPLPGVNVYEKSNPQNGVITGVDGAYSITLGSPDDVLMFTFIGFENQEIIVGGSREINITLMEESVGMDEVVVVGYGTLDKREVTSSVASVRSKDLIPGLSGNALTAMEGKVAGLSIRSTNGTSPNAGTTVQLRGIASVSAGKGPLVVIDGVPGGDINSVNREDVQSIDVLKDASAGAIYGTRAAGGVILITTKQAQAGKMQLSYTGEFTTETILEKPELLSAEQFLEYNLGDDLGSRTDWYSEVTRKNPFRQRHHVNMSGGTETARIYATFIKSSEEGIAIGDKKEEIGGRINGQFQFLNGFAEVITHADLRRTNSDVVNNDIFRMAMRLNPTLSPYDDTKVHGLNVFTGGWEYYNPVANVKLANDHYERYRLLADVTLKLNLTKSLSTQFMAATQNANRRRVYYESAQHTNSVNASRDGLARQSFNKWDDKTFEWINKYKNTWGDHRINAVGGYSFQEFNSDGFNMINADFPVDGIGPWDMAKGTYLSEGKAGMGSSKGRRTRLIAFFGRANYTFKDKYILSLSGRYEGSSKFYKDNRWGFFPAVSAGWRVNEEAFMNDIDFINELKLRGGYGVTGNEAFNSSAANRVYRSDTWWLVDGNWLFTYGTAHNQNKELQWEEKKEYNIGLDYSIWNNRISGKFDYYNRTVDRMIYNKDVSVPPAVHSKTTMNVGSLVNKGWEAEVTYRPILSGSMSSSTTLLVSHNKSEIESLWDEDAFWDRKPMPSPGHPGNAVRLMPGREIGEFYVWRHAGITEDGNWLLYDKDDNVIDVTEKTLEDKVYTGNAMPKLQLSLDQTFRYKNWEMNAFFTSWIGHDVFNMIDMYYGLPNVSGQNVLESAITKHKNIAGEKQLTDYWIEDGTFVKLKALTLRYNLDVSNLSFLQKANVYVTGRNLFTITGYSGLDPETNLNGLDPGFEEHKLYPRTRVWTLGVQLTF
ncbi:MAG: SusC/RagA family TonB-linked outer membrane protein [Carboxylicivirga sp.]|nr:SusC/RagA family TonB-linked outer membrane protein [Carboxylicivirga sp.]